VTSFRLGAVYAATPGHGKTIAASYIVGARRRPVDALVLDIFVTLSHTSGITLVAALDTWSRVAHPSASRTGLRSDRRCSSPASASS
jgi:ABC-type nickel/cobalt efflux system permease component RcnA